jgi:hypothetical protein
MMRPHQGFPMRTTLDIDDDVLQAAREHAALERKSLGAVISELARDALRRPHVAAAPARSPKRGGRFAVLPRRDEVVTVEHVRGLRDTEGV